MPLLLFLLLCQSVVHSANISFDGSKEVDCLAANGGCAFTNASIWINNIVPSINDSVVITGVNTFSSPLLVTFPDESNIQVASLVVQGANIQLNNQSTFRLIYLELGAASLFTVLDGSLLQGVGISNLTLSPSASLHVHGIMSWYTSLFSYYLQCSFRYFSHPLACKWLHPYNEETIFYRPHRIHFFKNHTHLIFPSYWKLTTLTLH